MNTLSIRQAASMKEGEGAEVKRLMPLPQHLMNYDPFVLFDHFQIQPGNGFPDHPHRGFEAITYLFKGSICHTDNLGNHATVHRGGAQSFTAGSGIVHSEMPAEEGISEGIQLWINLPKALKQIEPRYQQWESEEIEEEVLTHGLKRIILGEGSHLTLHTPACYFDITLHKGSEHEEQLPESYRGFVYVVEGELNLNDHQVNEGEAAFFEQPEQLLCKATEDVRFLVCAGIPHGEPINQHGPYVD